MDKTTIIDKNMGIDQLDDDERNVQIEDAVRQIVDDASGGIKFLELLAKLLHDYNVVGVKVQKIEKIIRNMPDVQVLDYTWKSQSRTKMFVYTK